MRRVIDRWRAGAPRRRLLAGCLAVRIPGVKRAARVRADFRADVSRVPEVPAAPGSLRLLTLNLAHGRGLSWNQALLPARRIRRNLDAVAELLQDAGADIVGLQETDTGSAWSGRFDHAEYIADRAGYTYVRTGVTRRIDGPFPVRYGNAILSRHPIGEFTNHPFGGPWRCGKGFLLARIDLAAGPVRVAVAHLGFLRARTRRAQAAAMTDLLRPHAASPLVVMGDLNCAADGREGTVRDLGGSLDLRAWPFAPREGETFPSPLPRARLDHILVGGGLRLDACRIPAARLLSDHLPVLATVTRAPRTPEPPGGKPPQG